MFIYIEIRNQSITLQPPVRPDSESVQRGCDMGITSGSESSSTELLEPCGRTRPTQWRCDDLDPQIRFLCSYSDLSSHSIASIPECFLSALAPSAINPRGCFQSSLPVLSMTRLDYSDILKRPVLLQKRPDLSVLKLSSCFQNEPLAFRPVSARCPLTHLYTAVQLWCSRRRLNTTTVTKGFFFYMSVNSF